MKDPFVHGLKIGKNTALPQTLNTNEIDESVDFILADVYSAFSNKDHFVFWFEAKTCDFRQSPWTASERPGNPFIPKVKSQLQKALIHMDGQGSGFMPYYGKWSTSVVIPVTGKSFSVCINGMQPNGTGNIQLIVRGFYKNCQ